MQHRERLETAARCQSTVQEQEEEEGLGREMRAERARCSARGGEAMCWSGGSAATERGPKMGCGLLAVCCQWVHRSGRS